MELKNKYYNFIITGVSGVAVTVRRHLYVYAMWDAEYSDSTGTDPMSEAPELPPCGRWDVKAILVGDEVLSNRDADIVWESIRRMEEGDWCHEHLGWDKAKLFVEEQLKSAHIEGFNPVVCKAWKMVRKFTDKHEKFVPDEQGELHIMKDLFYIGSRFSLADAASVK